MCELAQILSSCLGRWRRTSLKRGGPDHRLVFLGRLDRVQGLTRCTKQIDYHCLHHLDKLGNLDGKLGNGSVGSGDWCIQDEGCGGRGRE